MSHARMRPEVQQCRPGLVIFIGGMAALAAIIALACLLSTALGTGPCGNHLNERMRNCTGPYGSHLNERMRNWASRLPEANIVLMGCDRDEAIDRDGFEGWRCYFEANKSGLGSWSFLCRAVDGRAVCALSK